MTDNDVSGIAELPRTGPLLDLEDDALYARLDKMFHKCLQGRSHKERATLLNLSFYLGIQNLRVTTLPTGQQQFTVQTPKRARAHHVENHIRPMTKAEVARINRNKPIGWVQPQGRDIEDVEAAEAAQDLIEHVWRSYGLQKHTQHATWWSCIGGTALLGLTYDDSATDPHGQQGAFVPRSLGPLEFCVPDILNPELDEQPYLMIHKAYHRDEIWERWGIDVMGSTESFTIVDNRLLVLLQQQNVHALARYFGSLGGPPSSNTEKQVLVRECWVKPNPATAPNGAIIVFGGRKVLGRSEWPEWLRASMGFTYPFARIAYNWEAGFWGGAFIDDLVEPQRRRNQAVERVANYLRLMSKISTALPKGTEPRHLFDGEATIWEVPPGMAAPSHPVVPPILGDTVKMELENTAQALQDLSYQHEVTKGTTPPNVRAGIAIEALKEADDSPLSISIESIEEAHARLGNVILATVKGNWDEPRLITVVGEDGIIEGQSFLNGDQVGGQYVVQGGSAWPFFRYERQAQIMDLVDREIIPKDMSLRLLDLGAIKQISDRLYVDERQARRENQMFKGFRPVPAIDPATGMVAMDPETGEPVLQPSNPLPFVQSFDNHQVHLEMHYNEMKRASFIAWNDEAKEALLEHTQAHLEAIAQINLDTQGPSPEEEMDFRMQGQQAQEQDEQRYQTQRQDEQYRFDQEQETKRRQIDASAEPSGVQGRPGQNSS